jgi:hypothetical protein
LEVIVERQIAAANDDRPKSAVNHPLSLHPSVSVGSHPRPACSPTSYYPIIAASALNIPASADSDEVVRNRPVMAALPGW